MNELMALLTVLLFILQVRSMPSTVPTPVYLSEVPTFDPTTTTMKPSISIPSTTKPSNTPTKMPALNPSSSPTLRPTTPHPSISPTLTTTMSHPSSSPTLRPTTPHPSSSPTLTPTMSHPSSLPTVTPTTHIPSHSPSVIPSTIHPTKPFHERYGNGSLSNKVEALFMLLSLLFLVIGAMYYVYLREKSRQEPKHVVIRRDEDDIQLDLELNEVDYDNPWSIVSYMKSRAASVFSLSQFNENVYSSVNLNGSDDGSNEGK